MIIGIISVTVLAAIAILKRPTNEEALRRVKAKIDADAEIAEKSLHRAICGSELEQKLSDIRKKAKTAQNQKKLAEWKAKRAEQAAKKNQTTPRKTL